MMREETRDWYRLLGVDETADRSTIKKAYLKAIRTYHPDVAGPEGEEMTVLLNEAWNTLSDETRRADYDRSRRPKTQPTTTPTPGSATPTPAPPSRTDNDLWDVPLRPDAPVPQDETITPHQTRWWEIPLMLGATLAAGALLGWATAQWSPDFTALVPLGVALLLFASLADGCMWRLNHGRATLWTARLVLTVGVPALIIYAQGGQTAKGGIALILAILTSLAARQFAWTVRDIRAVAHPGVGAYPTDAARVFEQAPASGTDPVLDVLRAMDDVPGARLFHNLCPPLAPVGIDHAVVVGTRIALIVPVAYGVDPRDLARFAKTLKKVAAAVTSGLPTGHTTRLWIVANGCQNPPRVRGVDITTTAQLGAQVRAFLKEGPVRRRTLQHIWQMCA